MASKLIIGFVLAVLFSCLSVQGQNNTCRVAASIAKRSGSDYVQGGRNYSVYDITLNNVGSCTVQTVNIVLNITGTIDQYWNLRGSPINEVTGFGGFLAPGQTFAGSGLIVSNNGRVSASISVTSVSCRSCNTTTSGPVTTSSSSANATSTSAAATTRAATTGSTANATSTSAAATTRAATTGSGSATTGSTTGGYTGCPAAVNTTLRQTYSTGSTINYVYDISVRNLSPYVLNTVEISYGIESNSVTQTWNLVKTCCTQVSSSVSYNVSVYNLQPGGTFNGAGFIQTLPSGTPYTAPVAQVFNPATGRFCGF